MFALSFKSRIFLNLYFTIHFNSCGSKPRNKYQSNQEFHFLWNLSHMTSSLTKVIWKLVRPDLQVAFWALIGGKFWWNFDSNLNSNLQLNHNLVFWINCWSSLSSNVFPGIKTSIEPTSLFWSTAEKESFHILVFCGIFFDLLSGLFF